jgi:hypothetical protein
MLVHRTGNQLAGFLIHNQPFPSLARLFVLFGMFQRFQPLIPNVLEPRRADTLELATGLGRVCATPQDDPCRLFLVLWLGFRFGFRFGLLNGLYLRDDLLLCSSLLHFGNDGLCFGLRLRFGFHLGGRFQRGFRDGRGLGFGFLGHLFGLIRAAAQ